MNALAVLVWSVRVLAVGAFVLVAVGVYTFALAGLVRRALGRPSLPRVPERREPD